VQTSSASTDPVDVDRRWLPVGIAAVAVAAAVAMDLVIRSRHGDGLWTMHDLGVYRWGGEQARTGGDLYGGFLEVDQVVPGYKGPNLSFTYTPAAALAFIPLSWLPFTLSQPIMLLVDAAATAVIVGVSLAALGYRAGPGRIGLVLTLTAGSLLLDPVAQTSGLGQINLVLAALCLVDLCLPDDSRVKGIGVGLATAVKLTPAIFIVFLALTGRKRPAVRAVVAAGATALVAFAVLPGPSWRYWVGGSFFDSSRIGRLTFVGNQSVNGVLARLWGPGPAPTLAWLIVAAIVGTAALAAAVAWHRHGERLIAVIIVAVAGLLIAPVAWSHHWVWIVPVVVLGLEAVRRGRRWVGWPLAGMLAAFAVPGILWRLPRDNDLERDWSGWELLVGNLYVWIGLAGVAVAFATRPRTDHTDQPVSAALPEGPPRSRSR
jgi:alpha-1,2-mannosyltransferase